MKTLLLLRHAKSSWDDPALRDFDRPLAGRGKRDAPRIGKALRKSGPIPDLIISSPAVRAKKTIESVAASARLDAEVEFDESIYGASAAELLRVISRLPNDKRCVMFVGHNPGFEDLVARLIGTDERMPTAALACIEIDADSWEEVEDRKGKLASLITPRQLREREEGG